MASVNKVILVGNLGRDPEMRYSQEGTAFATISIATTERYKDKNSGEQKEITEWHRVAFAGRLAEVVGEYLQKGSSVYIEGKLRTRKWTDQSGVERFTTEVFADTLQMLGSPSSGGSTQGAGASASGSADEYPAASGRSSAARPAACPTPAKPVDDLEDTSF